MEKIELTIPGKAVAKQSARFCQIAGFIKSYQKKDVIEYANLVKLRFMNKYPEHKVENLKNKMLKITIIEFRQIPVNKSNKFKWLALNDFLRPITKPDTDNIAKNIKDGLNKIAYPDDSQIVTEHIEKHYSDNPRVEITIEEYHKCEEENSSEVIQAKLF